MFQEITNVFLEYGFLITQAQASRLLGISKTRIRQMIKEGKIKSVEILGTEMVRFGDLQKWI